MSTTLPAPSPLSPQLRLAPVCGCRPAPAPDIPLTSPAVSGSRPLQRVLLRVLRRASRAARPAACPLPEMRPHESAALMWGGHLMGVR
ncbi:hypothetical protein JOF48_002014 [Arthrobacter stackebrandtii]|uniref:Uncharacterized protein n=1 Tax=Arthrobacter stackebrandtii TaxID=272161 RepID=A0ABS4YWK2_9MICC|nr:hypothetical protein [Arthrobacter stackebrandtii]